MEDLITSFKEALAKVAPIFEGFSQNDAHELFRLLIEKIHDEMNTASKRSAPYKEFKSPDDLTLLQKAEKWNHYSKKRDDSLITSVFGGSLLNEIKCESCNFVSYSFEDTLDFSLNLAKSGEASSSVFSDNTSSLVSCFDEFVEPEPVEGYTCSKCKEKDHCVKRTTIWKQPEVLVVQLKRFIYNYYGGRDAVKDKISFPLNDFTLSPYMHEKTEEQTDGTYKLYGIVNHFGSLEFGHYIAFVYNEELGTWLKYNDDTVTPISETKMANFVEGSVEPYILFYKRA